ncbi:MAG: methyltransferase domain-containing protein [Vicinamibacterales bacterium]
MRMARSDPWEDFVRREPFFSMAPLERYRRANLKPAEETAYFAAGEARLAWMFQVLKPLTEGAISALDYDCGLGRLTIPLAKRLHAVTAVSRSSALLEHTRAHVSRRGLTHVRYQAADEFDQSTGTFDFVVCELTLQRLPRSEGLDTLRCLLQRVGPGGVGVIEFPYMNTAGPAVRLSRWLRVHVPGVARLANCLQGKPIADPFIPTHAYPLDKVLTLVREARMESTIAFLDHESDPPTATVFVRAPLAPDAAAASFVTGTDSHDVSGVGAVTPSTFIDVRELIAATPIEELNRKAEAYFSTLTDWGHHLVKPFASADEAAPLLGDTAILLQGLQLRPGLRVLDFGAGSGWLSRWMTELGCAVTLLDVSPTALSMARRLYERLPVIGDRPAPRFLQFDGRRIDLPDGSVDRIVCFHAFHHAANPDEMLREFARVLGRDGIAAFIEPGPQHSKSALSQFEMRTYGVVENDVDVNAIWNTAKEAGFSDIRLAVYHQPPFHVSLTEFQDVLAGGPVSGRWTESTRVFLREVRSFFLIKGVESVGDSRNREGLSCEIRVELASGPLVAGTPISVDATVTNSGLAPWRPWGLEGGVALGTHVYEDGGTLVDFDFHCEPLTNPTREIAAGETVRVLMGLPALPPGRYRLEFDCVAAGVTWFAQVGSRPVSVFVRI